MAIWPFNRRRRRSSNANANTNTADEKTQAGIPAAASADAAPPPTSSIARRLSRKTSQRPRRASQQEKAPATPWVDLEKRPNSDKDNLPFRYHTSRENITALPGNRKLDQSPHLRAIDQDNKARIPYNFRPYSLSQTSLQPQEATGKLQKPQRPSTLRSKRSTTDYSAPTRQTSSRKSKKRDERLREEEIRMMSSPIPIPRRTGDGPLRRESKKHRGLAGVRDSEVSLPPDGSVHSSMSGPMEQRGWEVGSFAVFNPRPAVRLSGTPQYVVSSSLPTTGPGVLYHIESRNDESRNGRDGKQKTKSARDTKRRLPTVGDEADDLDSSDIRALMEREAKRRVRRDQERMEKLDRKLRNRVGRERGDSDRKRRDMADEKRIEQARLRAGEQLQAHGPVSPPTAVHPALRGDLSIDQVGLGIAKSEEAADVATEDEAGAENLFVDAMEELPPPQMEETRAPPPMEELQATAGAPVSTPLETPFEDAVLETAQAVRLSQAYTPPLSPVYQRGSATHSSSQLTEAIRQQSISHQSMSHHSMQSATDLPRPPRIDFNERRSSDPPNMAKDRRTGTWAAIFRRGGTFRRGGDEGRTSPSEFSFSNTSRESMRNQPIPAHLIDPNAHRPPQVRRISGTPVRTMSKFREDLPDAAALQTPPDSRTQSPDVIIPATGLVAVGRHNRPLPQPVDIRRNIANDGPNSPNRQPPLSASMASVGSEGSWLASGSIKRHSQQSNMTRPFSRRNADFSASYEDLGGGDRDAEYFTSNAGGRTRTSSNPALMGASPSEESEEEGDTTVTTSGEMPLTVHGSVRRKPTLVQRDSRLKSREGLVTEYAGNIETVETPPDEGLDRESDAEDYEPAEVERARSVNYGSRHSRQFSAGSARLLDVQRSSIDLTRQRTPTPTQVSSTLASQRQDSVETGRF